MPWEGVRKGGCASILDFARLGVRMQAGQLVSATDGDSLTPRLWTDRSSSSPFCEIWCLGENTLLLNTKELELMYD